jgi:ABC-2 type transport system ATP-binding protein
MQDAVITVEHLTRTFGSFTAVDAVSFEVARGEIFGYLGANGAGKTTTIRMLCGLLAPSAGQATVAGHDVGRHARRVKRAIGYMSQRFSLYLDLQVEENLQFFAGAYGLSGKQRAARVAFALDYSGLADRRHVMTGALPGGIRQRLALASALLHEPEVVFLDEPTAGVDPASRRDFWGIIRRLARTGTTLFVTTHHLDEAEYCGRVGLMVDGRLVALDTPEGLKAEHVPGVLWRLAGAEARAVTAALGARDDVLQIQPFGNRVHVRVRGALAAPGALAAALSGAGVPVAVEPAEATLEDVFLELVGRSAAAANAGEVA